MTIVRKCRATSCKGDPTAYQIVLPVQFTELQQKEQLAKLAMARNDLAAAPSARKFKFISNVNSQVSVRSCC